MLKILSFVNLHTYSIGSNFQSRATNGNQVMDTRMEQVFSCLFIAFSVNNCLFVRMTKYEVFLAFATKHRCVWIITQQLISNCVRTQTTKQACVVFFCFIFTMQVYIIFCLLTHLCVYITARASDMQVKDVIQFFCMSDHSWEWRLPTCQHNQAGNKFNKLLALCGRMLVCQSLVAVCARRFKRTSSIK